MSCNLAHVEEIVHLSFISQDETAIDKQRLRTGDRLIRSAIGESVLLTNGIQVMVRPGYFSLSAANGVTIERRKDGITCLIFANGDELRFNDIGIQSLQRDRIIFNFVHEAYTERQSA